MLEATAACDRQRHFTLSLPKIELHAHLNGSIRRSTLDALAAAHDIDAASTGIMSRWPSTLSEAFDVFRLIHECVSTLSDVERIAFELGQDLERDGVVYGEIRTTPRDLDAKGWDGYVKAVLHGFERYTKQGGSVILKLLLSIDRAKHSADDAMAVVQLAHRYRQHAVVGIDLSGDPTKAEFSTFLPSLSYARTLGLKITLHAAEVRNDDEFSQMLHFAPHRFGHCCFVSRSNLAALKQSKIPIELCLTSNLLSNSIPSGLLADHHFGIHYQPQDAQDAQEHVDNTTICCISTDDSGVFGSPLSNEYRLVMDNFKLTESQVFDLARRTLKATFLDQPPFKSAVQTERNTSDWQRVQSRFDQFQRTWRWQ